MFEDYDIFIKEFETPQLHKLKSKAIVFSGFTFVYLNTFSFQKTFYNVQSLL